MSELIHCPAVIALELPTAQALPRTYLDRVEAEQLAALIAEDLLRLVPAVVQAHLVVAAALFDPAQLLRPTWPVYAELADLTVRALPDDGQRHVLAFGSHGGAMPTPLLQPEALLKNGVMLLLPWMLSGDAANIETIGEALERDLVARGELGPRVADFLMRSLGVQFEHARYLTRHDVCALTCVQLEHMGLSALWQLLETALLSPQATRSAVSTRGRRWDYRDAAAHCGMPSYPEWYSAHGHALETTARAHAYAGWLFELRQYAALLDAHRLSLRVEASASAEHALEILAPLDPASASPILIAHEAPGLGIVVLRVVQQQGAAACVLAQAYPLRANDLDELRTEFAQRYGASELRRLGHIAVDTGATDLDSRIGVSSTETDLLTLQPPQRTS